jgi:hypothetical protein
MRKRTDSFWLWGSGLAALVVVAVAVFYITRGDQPVPTDPVVAVPIDSPPRPAPRPVPIVPPASQRTVPLPALDASDPEVQGGLTEVLGRDSAAKYLSPERIIRNVVVSIDNATREKMALNQRPIKPTGGAFVVQGADETLVIGPANYSRYTPFITVVNQIDAQTIVGLYRGLQPLFQQAYEDLGNPNKIFNSRLLEVIDHLLETPEVNGPIKLVQPSVYYRYADPKLEELSAGQKLLLRMGPENAQIIKAKLREIQAALS